jgi:lipoprotein-releasing system permease protein
MIDGNWIPQTGRLQTAVGAGLAYTLGISPEDLFSTLQFYYPDKTAGFSLNPEEAFRTEQAKVTGVFQIQQEFDNNYVLAPIDWVQELTGNNLMASALEVSLKPGTRIETAIKKLEAIAGPRFKVLDRKKQHAYLYKIFQSEKLAIYVILAFILILASFGIIGSLSMLMIEKKSDVKIMMSLGADFPVIRKIFFTNGLLLTAAGLISGLISGTLICKAQQHFKFIKLGHSGDFVVDAYPVDIQPGDLLMISAIVLSIGLLLSGFIVNKMIRGM